MALAFTLGDEGCYADGSLGHDHIRSVLASLVDNVWNPQDMTRYGYDVAESLRRNMTDDASEEDDALDILQQYTDARLTWQFEAGDLLLLKDEDSAS